MTDFNSNYARWLVGQAKSGRMSRREFLGRTSAIGIALGTGAGAFSSAMASELVSTDVVEIPRSLAV